MAELQANGLDTHSITGDAQLGNPAASIDTNFAASWTIEQKLEHIRAQVRVNFCPSGSNLINQGAQITDYHNSGPGDHTGEDQEIWYGTAPDIGACEFIE